jgi:hypothetical protein
VLVVIGANLSNANRNFLPLRFNGRRPSKNRKWVERLQKYYQESLKKIFLSVFNTVLGLKKAR